MATDTQFIGLGWAGDTGGQDRSTIQATIKPHENRASQGYPQKSSRRGDVSPTMIRGAQRAPRRDMRSPF